MTDKTEPKATGNGNRKMKWWEVIIGVAVMFLIPWLLQQRGMQNGQRPVIPFPFNVFLANSGLAGSPPAAAGRRSTVGRWTTADLSEGVPATLTLTADGSLTLEVRTGGSSVVTGTWTVDGDDLSLWTVRDGKLRLWSVAKILSDASFSVTNLSGARAVFTRAP